MIETKIAERARAKGFENAFSLQKALNISPTVAARLWKGKFKKIGIDTLDKLCTLLKSQVHELLFFTGEVTTTARPVKTTVKAAFSVENDVAGMLSLLQVAERLGLSRKRVNDYVNQGRLKATKNRKGHNFVSEPDLQAFIDS
jgi:DNA-binding Xre family transcriptional regulator/biotin operon repressor